jgi:hypothetical protein
MLAFLVAVAVALWPLTAWAQINDDEYASRGEWIFLVVLTTISALMIALAIIAWQRGMNPHTGLPHQTRRRRPRDDA